MNKAQYEAKKRAHLQKAELRKAQIASSLKVQRGSLLSKTKKTIAGADKNLSKWDKRVAKWDKRAAKWSA